MDSADLGHVEGEGDSDLPICQAALRVIARLEDRPLMPGEPAQGGGGADGDERGLTPAGSNGTSQRCAKWRGGR